MIVTIDTFQLPELQLQLVAVHCCDGVLPRTKHEFDQKLREALRQILHDAYRDTEAMLTRDPKERLRNRIELLRRSARKGGWLT